METLHRSLGPSFLQRVDNPLFEDTPVIEGFDPKEVDQREKFFDLVLAVAKINDVRRPSLIECLHRSAGEAPAVVAFELEAGLCTLGGPVLDCMRFV